MSLTENLEATVSFMKEQGVGEVEFGLILGSGLGELAEEIEEAIVIPYDQIPHFAISTVTGRGGTLGNGL